MEKKLFLDYLLRPHWPTLAIAFVAIIFEGLADLLEPWPIKIVLDYVIGSKQPPQWLTRFIASGFGADKIATLNLAVAAVVVVAVVGAVSTYTEKYGATKVGQEVMCDLRQAVYHHIQRLSLSFYDRSRVGDLISRVTVDIALIHPRGQSLRAGGLRRETPRPREPGEYGDSAAGAQHQSQTVASR